MTDRHSGYLVVLEEPIREDDAQQILSIMKNLKGVISVEPIIEDAELILARAQIRNELVKKLWEVLR